MFNLGRLIASRPSASALFFFAHSAITGNVPAFKEREVRHLPALVKNVLFTWGYPYKNIYMSKERNFRISLVDIDLDEHEKNVAIRNEPELKKEGPEPEKEDENVPEPGILPRAVQFAIDAIAKNPFG